MDSPIISKRERLIFIVLSLAHIFTKQALLSASEAKNTELYFEVAAFWYIRYFRKMAEAR